MEISQNHTQKNEREDKKNIARRVDRKFNFIFRIFLLFYVYACGYKRNGRLREDNDQTMGQF